MTDFALTAAEKSHPLWVQLKAHLQDQLAGLRVRNDSASMTEQDTAALRGRIHQLKAVIALGNDPPLIEE